MPTGAVKWFDSKKGYGFLLNTDGKDVFVHYTGRALRDALQEANPSDGAFALRRR